MRRRSDNGGDGRLTRQPPTVGEYYIECGFGSDSYVGRCPYNTSFISDHDDPDAAKPPRRQTTKPASSRLCRLIPLSSLL